MTETPSVAGLVLAGGLARRMGGGAKALKHLAGRPLLAHVLARITPQCHAIVLNANGDPGAYETFGYPVLADVVDGFAGPLAGVLTGLEWLDRTREADWLLTVPTDAPFLPDDLVARLLAGIPAGAEVAVARSEGRTHPVVALWHRTLLQPLRTALVAQDIRKIDRFTAGRQTVHVDWPTVGGDPFLNINTPEELVAAETRFNAAT
ncbi:MAG: molybdenum cofactor guanylyltransferase [Minwuia thermotolerans]|nr:MAG: molybdenum cofactor guanylyltransferase [Minwuia thermotolerans]